MQLWQIENADADLLTVRTVLQNTVDDEVFIGPDITHGHVLFLVASLSHLLLDSFLVLATDLLHLQGGNEARVEVGSKEGQLLLD